MTFRSIGALKNAAELREYLTALGIPLSVDERVLSAAEDSPLAEPCTIGEKRVGNRWAAQPMEGWDGTPDGQPTEHTLRRWRNFGASGCKLIWGGEAYAVCRDGRANPRQLYYRRENEASLRLLREALCETHIERFGRGADADLLVGLQLTHSGRFARPENNRLLQPRIAYHHPLLDPRCGIAPDDDQAVLTDDEVRQIVDAFVAAAAAAQRAGFHFVDVKHCHGYLGHEFLSAYERGGPYGGELAGRTRFLREIVAGIRAECPGLMIGVRLSLFDGPPFRAEGVQQDGHLGTGLPERWSGGAYPAFGCDRAEPLRIDLREPIELLTMLRDDLKIDLLNVSAGSPYYNPHLQRPAYYPPSDGYAPPEDPLVGCVRQMEAVAEAKRAVPGLPMVGSAYSYFQEFLPNIAQAQVREGSVDFVGIGRMLLSYWDLPADVLAGRPLRKRRICRTFSDCTTAPRNGIISGCFPLDAYYKSSAEAAELKLVKQKLRSRGG